MWSSKLGLALAAAGSAIGLGNFLRFPGQAYMNGGGAFLVPYIICFFLIAIPLCWLEWSLGKLGGSKGAHSGPGILLAVSRNRLISIVIGSLTVLIPAGIYAYYAVIQSWCLHYFLIFAGLLGDHSFSSPEISKTVFATASKMNNNGFELSASLLCLLVTIGLNAIVVYRGFIKSVEKFCTIAIPFMAVLAIFILIRVLTLGTPDPAFPERNVWNALGFMWNPRIGEGEAWWQIYLNPDIWLAAFGQVFFSISVGFGILLHYASYVRKNEDIALTSYTATSANGFFEVCVGGMITIPVIFLFLGDNFNPKSSFDLGFISMPLVFERLAMGNLFGALWFLMLFLAAITSSVSMITPIVAFVRETLNCSGKTATVLTLAKLSIFNLICFYYSKDLEFLSSVDYWIGTLGIFLLAMGIVIVSVYTGLNVVFSALYEGALIKIPKAAKPIVSYVTPIAFSVVFLSWLFQNLIYAEYQASSFEKWLGITFSATLAVMYSLIISIFFKTR